MLELIAELKGTSLLCKQAQQSREVPFNSAISSSILNPCYPFHHQQSIADQTPLSLNRTASSTAQRRVSCFPNVAAAIHTDHRNKVMKPLYAVVAHKP